MLAKIKHYLVAVIVIYISYLTVNGIIYHTMGASTAERVIEAVEAGEMAVPIGGKTTLELFLTNPLATEKLMLFIVCMTLLPVIAVMAYLFTGTIKTITKDHKEMYDHHGKKITNLTSVMIDTTKEQVEAINKLSIQITRLTDAITASDTLSKERFDRFVERLADRPCLRDTVYTHLSEKKNKK